jgi:hypothetical protein
MNVDMKDVLDLICQAMREERTTMSNMLYGMQGKVDQFATTAECCAYNKALREAAERMLALNE